MEKAKRARKAETLKQPSLSLRLRAQYLYPDPPRHAEAARSRGRDLPPPRAGEAAPHYEPQRSGTVACHDRQPLEVADIFRDHGSAWREANRGHISLEQMKVMSAIERCRTAALGGHVARCENEACGHTVIAYNSCRNRHCPKCQGAAARRWLAEREAELLPVPYFHVVYTLPSELRDIA